MKQFVPIHRPITPGYTLEVLNNAYTTLEKGHQDAIKAQSELKTAIAALPMNEQEDGFKNEMLNGINQMIEANTINGNAYFALDDIVKATGDLMSDPQVLGRMKAQQDYEAFLADLDSRTDLPDNYRDYFREKNPYHYEDKFDNKGNVIGGSKWEASVKPVDHVDISTAFEQAIKMASPETGAFEQVKFMDANGNITDTFTPGAIVGRFNTVTQQFSRLTAEKLNAALDAAIKTDPKLRASLHQEYDIGKWEVGKYGTPNLTSDGVGGFKTFEEYVRSMTDPFVMAKKYNNQIISNHYNDALLNSLATINAKAAAKEMQPTEMQPTESIGTGIGSMGTARVDSGNNIAYKDTSASEAVDMVKTCNAEFQTAIKELIGKDNDNFDFKAWDLTDSELNVDDLITKSGLLGKQAEDAKALYNTYKWKVAEALNYQNELLKDGDQKAIANFKFFAATQKGNPIDLKEYENNPEFKKIVDKYNGLKRSLFGDGDTLVQRVTDKNRLERFLANIGGQKALSALGIEVKDMGDEVWEIHVPDTIGLNIFKFTKAYEDAWDETNVFLRGGNNIKKVFHLGDMMWAMDSKTGEEYVRTDLPATPANVGGGSIRRLFADMYIPVTPIFEETVGTAYNPVSYLFRTVQKYDTINKWIDRVEDRSKPITGETNKVAQTYTFTGSPATGHLYQLAENGLPVDADQVRTMKAEKEAMVDRLRGLNPINEGVMIYDEKDRVYRRLKSEDINRIQNYLGNDKSVDELSIHTVFNKQAGKWQAMVAVPNGDRKHGLFSDSDNIPLNILFDDLNIAGLNTMNADPALMGQARVYQATQNPTNAIHIGAIDGQFLYAKYNPATDMFNFQYQDGSMMLDISNKNLSVSVDQVGVIVGILDAIKTYASYLPPESQEFSNLLAQWKMATANIMNEQDQLESFMNFYNAYN